MYYAFNLDPKDMLIAYIETCPRPPDKSAQLKIILINSH